MTIPEKLSPEEFERIRSQRNVRRSVVRDSIYWFCPLYLPHYITYPFAPFHQHMFQVCQDENGKLSIIVAFRGSGKSTIFTLAYPIWAIIGKQQKKFVLIVSQTQAQAKQHLANIRRELEGNGLLVADIGPFESPEDEWGANTLVLSDFGARITAVSTEQSIRGIRHGQYRPDLIICDDIEDTNSVKFKESRDRTLKWYSSEIAPLGDLNTKIILIGNLLHEDSLVMRIKNLISEQRMAGSFFAYPLIDQDGQCLWPQKFKNKDDLIALKQSIPSEADYAREYLLTIISDDGRLVHPEWIHYYDELPLDEKGYRFTATGIDLAISLEASADFTTMVSARVYDRGKNFRIYVLPWPVNKRMDFPTSLEKAQNLSRDLGKGKYTKMYVEDVAYQRSFIQQLVTLGVPAEGVKVQGQDKHARLASITYLVQQGRVLFPRHGAEDLIMQLTGFGIEKHDDLADAFSILMHKMIEVDSEPEPSIMILSVGSDIPDRGLWRELDHGPLTMDSIF